MDTRHRPRVLLPAAALALALLATGCAADVASTPTDTAAPTYTTAPTAIPSTSAPQSSAPYAVPDVDSGEKARAVFVEDGDDGIPTTRVTAVDSVVDGEQLAAHGGCVGDSVDYEVRTGSPAMKLLAVGTVDCAEGVEPLQFRARESGAVQVMFVSTDDVTDAWVRVVARDSLG